jgi:bifunctional oligoribonuclease and PAP phosphatase NrnA
VSLSIKKIAEAVRKYNNFLVTAHVNLEGDALGSELAFYSLLKKLGKKAAIVNEDGIPYGYSFLPGKENIRRLGRVSNKLQFDCFCFLDCSDLKRSGEVYRLNSKDKPVLNIDHHISNGMFGLVNWVDAHASSCSEMIYRLYREMGIAFDKDSALCLYVGMVTDTGSFRYSNTTSFTHKACARLLEFDLDITGVYKNVYEDIPYADMKLLFQILPGLRLYCNGKVACVQIKKEILRNKKLSFDLSEHVLSFARAIKGVQAVVLLKESLGTRDEI